MRAKQQGFTLVELVVVIAILGILAAVAIPRYTSYVSDARKAALNGLAGAIRSSVAVVQGRYVAIGNSTAATVPLADGTTVAVTTGANGGIPTVAVAGIQAAVNTDQSFTFVPATGVWNFTSGVIAGCNVTYAAAGTATVDSTSC